MDAPATTTGIVSFPPPLKENSYQRLLYQSLDELGFPMPDVGHFKVGWMLRWRRRVRFLHFHWPQDYYRHPPRPKGPWSWIKLALFVVRLIAARALGYRVVWTVHEVYPLATASRRLDRIGGRLLARFSNVMIANDEQTAEQARRELGRAAAHVSVVPHSSYTGVYPAGRSRADVRAELGIAPDDTVFLLFGHLTKYKSIEWLVDAFRAAGVSGARLLVAGLVMDEALGAAVHRAAAEDDRVVPLLEFISDDRVGELFGASDVAVCPRQDGGTSGVLLLALSMGLPLIAARVDTYTQLTGGERAAWLFEPGDQASAAGAFRRAVEAPEEGAAKAAAASTQVADLSWDEMGRRTAALLNASLGAQDPGTPIAVAT
jgi:glycosyltransferase involved in cell wall biosynthesis